MQPVTHNENGRPKTPERTCIGCRGVMPREALVRLRLVGAPPWVMPDLAAKLGGRGAWVCARRACIESAVKKGGLSRAAGQKVTVDMNALVGVLVDQLERRIEGLLSSAVRGRHVAVGTDAARSAVEGRTARLLVVAEDAAGRREELVSGARRLEHGHVVLGTKASLGRIVGRGEVGVLAILDAGIAAELVRAAERVAALSEDG